MSDITANAEAARESARTATGKFGVQEHSAPEAELAMAKRSEYDVLDELAGVADREAWQAEGRAKVARVQAFAMDAREAAPSSERAIFVWDYTDGATRLTWSHYEDADGTQVDRNDDGYPDINDFHFDYEGEAAHAGFETMPENPDSYYLPVRDVGAPEPARARADLAAGQKLEDADDALAIRHLLGRAMDNGLDTAAVENLTDAQLARVRQAMSAAEDLVRMAVEIKE